jgi:ArsR family transcriptional regulator, lead/cadmium/zinc/bismuth-responsive transcriptional repressor
MFIYSVMRDSCEIPCIHTDAVDEVKRRMPNSEVIVKVAEAFKILGDGTRVRILYALSRRELCVCDISVLLGMSQSAVSHQLRLLRDADLVRFRKEGKVVWYSLADSHVMELIGAGMEHARE